MILTQIKKSAFRFTFILAMVSTMGLVRSPSALPEQPQDQLRQGEISGHVYNADTGAPLADVAVTLGSQPGAMHASVVKHTAADGAYEFDGLAAGDYAVGAYRKGFTPVVYGADPYLGGWKTLVSLRPAQIRTGIDLKLNPTVKVTQMDAGVLPPRVASWGYWNIGPGLFSPGGRAIAIMLIEPTMQVVLFNRVTHAHLRVPDPAEQNDSVTVAWQGDTLYVRAKNTTTGRTRFFRATESESKEIPLAPPELAKLPAEQLASDSLGQRSALVIPEAGSAVGSAHVDDYLVKAENVGHGSFELFTQTTLGERLRSIASGNWELQNFIYEPDRSLILYLEHFGDWTWEGSQRSAIVLFDLKTWRRSQTAYLPAHAIGADEKLIAAVPEGGGYIVAYTLKSPCVSEMLSDGRLQEPKHELIDGRPMGPPQNVCFASIPLVSCAACNSAQPEPVPEFSFNVAVKDAETGGAISQAYVRLSFETGEPHRVVSYDAKADAQGHCRYTNIPKGTVRLVVTAERHQSLGKEIQLELM